MSKVLYSVKVPVARTMLGDPPVHLCLLRWDTHVTPIFFVTKGLTSVF